MYEEDLALNYQQWLICHKTEPNQINCMLGEPNNLDVTEEEATNKYKRIGKKRKELSKLKTKAPAIDFMLPPKNWGSHK